MACKIILKHHIHYVSTSVHDVKNCFKMFKYLSLHFLNNNFVNTTFNSYLCYCNVSVP